MRVSINLASEPYENLRPLYAGVVLAILLAVVLASLIGWNLRQSRNRTRMLTEQNDRYNKNLVNLQREQLELSQWLQRPEVQEIRDRSDFLNSLIVRKSLSWTQMFMDLEKVLPNRAQVTAIRPSGNDSAQAELKVTVEATSVGPLVQFLKNLEAAPEFESPVVESQRFPRPKGHDPNIVLELSVLYHQANGEKRSSSPPAGKEARRGMAAEPESPGKRPGIQAGRVASTALADAAAGRKGGQ